MKSHDFLKCSSHFFQKATIGYDTNLLETSFPQKKPRFPTHNSRVLSAGIRSIRSPELFEMGFHLPLWKSCWITFATPGGAPHKPPSSTLPFCRLQTPPSTGLNQLSASGMVSCHLIRKLHRASGAQNYGACWSNSDDFFRTGNQYEG